jgi:TPP-dependent pyruvate/acetoin dehydrogenase alpha subunit
MPRGAHPYSDTARDAQTAAGVYAGAGQWTPGRRCRENRRVSDAPAAPATLAGPASSDLSPEALRALHRRLLLPRLVEEKMLVLLRQGRLSKWFSGIGQEAIAVGLVSALREDDWILPLHRNLGVFTGRGLDLLTLFRQLLGRAGPSTSARRSTRSWG